MRKSLKELIKDFSDDTSNNFQNYLPFLKESDTFYFFTLQTNVLVEDIEWLDHVFVYDYLFKMQPVFSAMMRLGIEDEQLTQLSLPNTDFIQFSIAGESTDELVVSAEIEMNSNPILTLTFFDLAISINEDYGLKHVEKKRDGTLEIKDENFTISTDLELTQTIDGNFSFSLLDLNTYFAIADTGIIVSLKSMKYDFTNATHTLTLEDAGITLPATMLKKAENNNDVWEIKDEPITIESNISLTLNQSEGFNLLAEDISTSFAVGDTGFIISVDKMSLTNDSLSVTEASLILPKNLLELLGLDNSFTLTMSGGTITKDGFSGDISFINPISTSIAGRNGEITNIIIGIFDNKIQRFEILGNIENTIDFSVGIDNSSFILALSNLPLHLEFPPLKRVTKNSNNTYTIAEETFAIDLKIDGNADLTDLQDANLSVKTNTIPTCFSIADSGIIIEIDGLSVSNMPDYSITTTSAKIILPEMLFGTRTEITILNAKFTQNGFSGTVDLSEIANVTILGITGTITEFTIENNIPKIIKLKINEDTTIEFEAIYNSTVTPAFSFSVTVDTNLTIPLPPLKKVTIDNNYDITDEDFAISFQATASVSNNGTIGAVALTNNDPILFAIEIAEASNVIVHIVSGSYDQKEQIAKFDSAKIILPDLNGLELPELSLTNAKIDCQNVMFSGIVALDWELNLNDKIFTRNGDNDGVTLFGIPGGIEHVSLIFKDNELTGSDITGKLLIPYFDQPAEIRINLQFTENGLDFIIVLKALGEEVELRKEELIALYIRSLELKKEANIASFIINGGMQPLLMASDGLEWPRLDVKNLSIEQDITDLDKGPILKFEEAWVDLKELATVDLWGFHFELNRIGMGYEESGDKLWIDLTGNIKLMPQIPAGVEAKGFRITWPREIKFENTPPSLDDILNVASKLEIKFDGIYLEYGVPGTVEFEGLIRFIKETKKVGFAGDMVLRVPVTGLEIEAGLMVGMNFQEPPYPFLYMYFGIELPAGIPIAQSGLALKGAKGMFGLNVKPDKTPEQNWYYDWYKRGPIEGAHPTNKWTDARDAVAFGAGLTITTADGTLMGVKGLMVIALPGPFLMIEGTALVFDGVLPSAPLKALAIFDGTENTVQFNLAAEAEIIEDMLEAHGVIEAFFDFDDVTKWHLYLGERSPEERRIQANILKMGDKFLFNANAYLMIDMQDPDTVQANLGAVIGFKPDIPDVGPVSITADITVKGEGHTTINPVYFDGELSLNAQLKVSIAGVGIQVLADAAAEVKGPKPVYFDALVKASVELPFALADIEGVPYASDIMGFLNSVVEIPEIPPLEIEVEFHWESNESYEPVSPLIDVSMENYFIQQAVRLDDNVEDSILVGMDHRPVLVFDQDMNVSPEVNSPIVGTPENTLHSYSHGDTEYEPYLQSISIHKKVENENSWTKITSTNSGDNTDPFYGVWRVDSNIQNPEKPPKRNLKLWSTFPFANLYTGNEYSIVEEMLGSVANIYQKGDCVEPSKIYVDFTEIPKITDDNKDDNKDDRKRGQICLYKGLEFKASYITYENDSLILSSSIQITFPEDIYKLYLTCNEQNSTYEMNGNKVFELDSKCKISVIEYITQNAQDAFEACKDQNTKLTEMFPTLVSSTDPVLQANCKYKIEIQTKINDAAQDPQTYHFHTEGPPNRLDRYIKHTYPAMEQNYIYLDDELSIRFKRPWIRKLYNASNSLGYKPYELEAYLRAPDGSLISDVVIQWNKAKSATLTPDEQIWYEHMNNQNNEFNFPFDDEIKIIPGNAQWKTIRIEEKVLNRIFDRRSERSRITPFAISHRRYLPNRRPSPMPVRRFTVSKMKYIVALQNGIECHDEFDYEVFCLNQSSTDIFGIVYCYQDKRNYHRFAIDAKTSLCKIEKIRNGQMKQIKKETLQINPKDIQSIKVECKKIQTQTKNGYSFEFKINNNSFMHYYGGDLNRGEIGTIKSKQNSVEFMAMPVSLKAHSRYSLILAGGSGGQILYSTHHIQDEIKSFCNDGLETCKQTIVDENIANICTDTKNWEITETSIRSLSYSELFFDKLKDKNIDLKVDFLAGEGYGLSVADCLRIVLLNDRIEIRRSDTNYVVRSIALNSIPTKQTVRINIFDSVLKVFCQEKIIQVKNLFKRSGKIGLFATTADIEFTNLSIREAEILKIPFMTSAFKSLKELWESVKYYNFDVDGYEDIPSTEHQSFIKSKWELEKAKVDLKDGINDLEGIQNKQDKLKKDKLALDDIFASVSPQSFYYEDTSDHIEVYKLINNGRIEQLYLRSPEPMQVQYKIEENSMTLGYAKVKIKINGRNIGYSIVCSSSENQAVIQLDNSIASSEDIVVDVTIQQDHKDYDIFLDHRYDRIEMSNKNIGYVRGYTRRDGTHVHGYYRSPANSTRVDNYGRSRNAYEAMNPYARDYDKDGIINMYDIDDNNDGVLDDDNR